MDSYLDDVDRVSADLQRAGSLLVGERHGWPDHIAVVAATLTVENAHRRWQHVCAPTPRLASLHGRCLATLRVLAETMPLLRRAVGARDEHLLDAMTPSLDGLFRRAVAQLRTVRRYAMSAQGPRIPD